MVRVGERHEVGGDGGFVGLLQAREREGTGYVSARGGVGGFGRLVGVQRAAVVFWWSEVVSWVDELVLWRWW